MNLKSLILLFFVSIFSLPLFAQLQGIISDQNGDFLPYVNVYVKNTTIGTTSNLDGAYNLKLEEGEYEIHFQYVGYKTISKKVLLDNEILILNLTLTPENYTLDEITISAQAEDPAYAIIRKAQAKRKYYNALVRSFECDAYVRGFNKILDAPEKILGFEIGDMDGVLDSSRQGVVYLSESVSKLYFKEGQQKEVMYSSKISGDDQGYSFNSAKEMTFNFYDNSINLNKKIISPIANSAMSYYDYKLEGATYDNTGQLVNKIQVIPKNEYAPCVFGHIYINEDLWNINSLELGVTNKSTQLAFIDSLTFKQTFVPLGKDVWMTFSNVISFKMRALGFVLSGNFAAVYSNYLLDNVDEAIFNNEVFKVEKEANERTIEYWEELRPIPLTIEESLDYVRKDSIQKFHESDEYLDSIDRLNNKFKILKILSDYSYQNSKKRSTISYISPISNISVNTVQGWNSKLGFSYEKSYDKQYTRTLSSSFNISYGSSEQVWRPQVSFLFRANKTNNRYFYLKGGKALNQFNSAEPISERMNMFFTLFARRNYMKLYDKQFLQLQTGQDLGSFLKFRLTIDYEKRNSLTNHYDNSLFYKDSRIFSDNIEFIDHKSLIIGLSLRIRPGEKLWSYPHQTFKVGSHWPTFWLHFKKGLGALDSDTKHTLVYATVSKRIAIGTIGVSRLFMSLGQFLGDGPKYFMDFHHFMGNQTHIAYPQTYNSSYLLLPYYTYSSSENFLQIHLSHNWNGFILNKLPLFKQLGWHLAMGYKYLNTSEHPHYQEYHLGIDNIGIKVFRMFRVDFVWQSGLIRGENNSTNNFGIVLGIKAKI